MDDEQELKFFFSPQGETIENFFNECHNEIAKKAVQNNKQLQAIARRFDIKSSYDIFLIQLGWLHGASYSAGLHKRVIYNPLVLENNMVLKGKLEELRKLGYDSVAFDEHTCNKEQVEKSKQMINALKQMQKEKANDER